MKRVAALGVAPVAGTFSRAGADAWAAEDPCNGKHHWYVSINGNGPGWMNLGVAVGDSSADPLISGITPNSSSLNIDPTVFADDDGPVVTPATNPMRRLTL